jgi:hypothetical protein
VTQWAYFAAQAQAGTLYWAFGNDILEKAPIIAGLNVLGEKGWELVMSYSTQEPSGDECQVLIFKKPAKA